MQVLESSLYEAYALYENMGVAYGYGVVISEWLAVVFVLVFMLSIVFANRYMRRCVS